VTYLASVASIQKSKSAVLVAVFVLCSALACWPQSAQANEPGSNPPRVGPVNRAAAQLEKLQPATLSGSRTQSRKGPIVIKEFKHDTGPLLREIAPLLPEFSTPSEHEIENNVNPNHNWSNQVQKDPVLQTEENSPRLQTPNFGLEFDGAGFGDGFFCNCMPPDNDGAVGTTQYVQYINLEYQVFDKSGNSVLGPLAGNNFWSGFGGSCQTDNSGDPIVRFDAAAQRWVVSQFAINGSGNDFECVAVSQTADATGAYNRYAFSFADFPDYPKMGVWPDAYYFTFNDFNLAGTVYVGVEVCAADRTKMLAGAAATMQCFPPSSSDFGMLPSDLDGATPPASGTPNFVMELDPSGSANLDLFQFHVDFTTPANSTFTGPTVIPVAAFTPLCNSQSRGACVPQPTGGSDLLESLGDRLMWRLVYRNFGDHTTLLVSHSIVAGSSGGVRWYEIRNPETSPTVFQSGTFAPDSQYRWMPAIAMDASQDIAAGYSRSGAAAGQFPSIVYAGRIPSDLAGTLESEVVLKAGLGSQTGGFNRWGDYSSLTVDPTDDCAFWFSEEYEKVTGGFNWSTAIGSFSFPGCAAGTTPTITNLSPPSGPVGAPVTISGANFGSTKGTSTVTFNGTTATTITSWSAISIVAPVPAGATTGNVVVTVGGVASNGSAFTVSVVPTIVWAQPSAITYGTTLSGILNATAVDGSNPVPGSFAYTATPQGGSPIGVTDATVLGGGSYTLTANFTPTDTTNYASASGSVSLTVAKATPTNALGSSADTVLAQTAVTFTATVSSSAGTPSGSVRFFDGTTLLGSVTLAQGVAAFTTSSLAAANHSITAVYGGDSNFLTVTSSVLTETVEDFALTVPTGDPTSATVSAGGTASYTVHVAPSNAQTFLSAIALNVTGAPPGATVTFLPPSLAAGAGATDVSLKVLVASQTAPIHSSGLLLKLSPVMAGMLLLPFSGKFRRAAGKHQRAVRLLLLFLATTSLAGIMACGGGSSSTSGNGPKIYTLTVTGASGTDSHTTILTLTVQ
jgi:hypothetical protein